MKIIADTNIWYGLGNEDETFQKVKDLPVAPTFVNIHELSKSENLIDKEDISRAAIRRPRILAKGLRDYARIDDSWRELAF